MITIYAQYGKRTMFIGIANFDMAYKLVDRGYRVKTVDEIGGEMVITFIKKGGV